jgi:hypothetical protein
MPSTDATEGAAIATASAKSAVSVIGTSVPQAAILSALASSVAGATAGTVGATPPVMKFINSAAVLTTESVLHPISIAIRKHAIR